MNQRGRASKLCATDVPMNRATEGKTLNKKYPDLKLVKCEPDQEYYLVRPEGGLYQVGGVILFSSREMLIQTLQRLSATVDGDDVWL